MELHLVERIVHLTTAHPPYDVRIFHKECRSLSAAGYDVHLLAHATEETADTDIDMHSLGSVETRTERWRNIPESYRRAMDLSADVYHLHDPELLPVANLLETNSDGKVVFDIHENYAAKVAQREWIPDEISPLAARGYPVIESLLTKRLDGIVTATEWIAAKFPNDKYGPVCCLRNFPLVEETNHATADIPSTGHTWTIGYVGGLGTNRGLFEMLQLAKNLRETEFDVGFWFIGSFGTPREKQSAYEFIEKNQLESSITLFGRISHEKIHSYLSQVDIGLALLDPDDCVGAIPTKIFDYMVSGTPILASRMESTEKYVGSSGTLVPFNDTSAHMQKAINLLSNDHLRQRMGQFGREQIESRFQWERESDKLVALYESILD